MNALIHFISSKNIWRSTLPLFILVMVANSACAVQHRGVDLLFNRADSDGNNLISEAEYHAAMQQRFLQLDSNKDGNLSRQEMENARAVSRERSKAFRGSGLFAN